MSVPRRTVRILIILVAAFGSPLQAEPPGNEAAMGPLSGRNLYAPHVPWFSFPADRASAMPTGTIVGRTALYYLNEFSTYPFEPDDYALVGGRLPSDDQDDRSALDYESAVWELGVDWQATPLWRFSADWRLHSRYGGGMDGTIEWWHGLLNTSNAGREYFDRNRAAWNVGGSNIDDFSGGGTTVAAGDLDLRVIRTWKDTRTLSLAAGAAFKVPTGAKSLGFGSGYPDIGAEFLLDWRPWVRWAFYADAGIILPLGPNGRVMGQFIPAVEFRVARGWSLVMQWNIQSSPVRGDERLNHPIFGETRMFALPQTDVRFGAKGRAGVLGWQFYFEEDPLTWEGPDILFFFGADWSFTPSGRIES